MSSSSSNVGITVTKAHLGVPLTGPDDATTLGSVYGKHVKPSSKDGKARQMLLVCRVRTRVVVRLIPIFLLVYKLKRTIGTYWATWCCIARGSKAQKSKTADGKVCYCEARTALWSPTQTQDKGFVLRWGYLFRRKGRSSWVCYVTNPTQLLSPADMYIGTQEW